MGCKYCNDEHVILDQECISERSWGWGGNISIKINEAIRYPLGLFIDRGYLRLVDLEDCNCLDSGEKIKINFCPFCGHEL